MSFPRINCFVTEFVWHLSLDPQRRLYKLPLTAASTPQDNHRSGRDSGPTFASPR